MSPCSISPTGGRQRLLPSRRIRPADILTDVTAPTAAPPLVSAAPKGSASTGRYDRSIVDGPLPRAVWKLAWPTMLTNIIGGLQGLVDHIMVGHFVGFK